MALNVHIFTTAFCNANVFSAGMLSLHDTVDFQKLGVVHHVLDNHYPLGRGAALSALEGYVMAHPGSATLSDPGKNLGLHEGLNFLWDKFGAGFDDDDLLIAYDADEAPARRGWVEAMLEVMESDPKCGWLSLNCKAINEALRDVAPLTTIGGHRLRIPPAAMMNVVVGWRVRCVRAMGRFTEPHAYYGGIESAMQHLARQNGFFVGFLEDFYTGNHRHLADAAYEAYKLRHVGHRLPLFPGSFDEFLEAEGNK